MGDAAHRRRAGRPVLRVVRVHRRRARTRDRAGVSGPELASLSLADPPERWRGLGFGVGGGGTRIGGVGLELGVAGEGIVGWELRGLDAPVEIDGLPWASPGQERADAEHPNGAI